MKNTFFGACAVFGLTAIVGYYAGGNSWKGVVYITDSSMLTSSTRTPAAIRRELDFSRLDGAELITATQKRLVTAAKTILQEGSLGIELGHFVTRDEQGQRKLACDSLYNRLTLQFESEGMASAGEKPMMTIDGPCATSQKDISAIEPVWVPVEKLLEQPAANSNLSFEDGVQFKFEEMNGSWPMFWKLKSVRLYNAEDKDHEVKISSRELRELRPKPLVLNWLEIRRAQIQKAAAPVKTLEETN